MFDQCPVCKTKPRKTESRNDRHYLECPRCGPFAISGTLDAMLHHVLSREADNATKVSFALYRMTKRAPWPLLTSDLVDKIVRNTVLPRPLEQLDNLILWLGEKQPNMGASVDVTEDAIAAAGATDSASVGFLFQQAANADLVTGVIERTEEGSYLIQSMQLTLNGWARFEELRRVTSSSRYAFIALQFGDAELDSIVQEHFKPSVEATGFTLKRLDDGQPAGLIDDRLRVEIGQARFLIADLTHANQGAYWEAGYAEGLGKPVIYTCRKDIFEDKTKGTHFDTNHHLTVIWEPENIADAMVKLKATIRATLPEEARFDQ